MTGLEDAPPEVAALIKKCALAELGARLATATYAVMRGETDGRDVILAAIAIVKTWRTT